MSSSLTAVPPPRTSVQIAHAFDLLAAANQWLTEELRWLADCENPLSQVSVNRLTALGRRMQPAAQARAALAHADPAVVLAGMAMWVGRQPARSGDRDSCHAQAQRLWAAGATL